MSDKDVTTPESEVNETSEETVNDEQESETPQETVGTFQEEETTSEKPDSVPIARLDKEIARRKELEQKLRELTQEKEEDPAVKDAEKDPDVKALAEKLAKIEEKEKMATREARLDAALTKALEESPEFADIANREVIKQMALNPANREKTFAQLLDEAYGNALGGKRTIESTTPRGGAKEAKVDIEKARRDNQYLKEVLADPELRKQYNEGLELRINL